MSSIRRPVAIFKELKELALLANAPVIDPEVCDILLVHSQPFVRDISSLPFHRVAFLSFYFVSLEHIRRTSSTVRRVTPQTDRLPPVRTEGDTSCPPDALD